MAGLNRGKQLTRIAVECLGNYMPFSRGNAHNSPLYPAHIAAVNPTDVGEILLRNLPAFSLFFDVFAKEYSQLIHWFPLMHRGPIVVTLRIYAPRTIIPFYAVSIAMTPNRDTIFFQILQEQKDQHLTVTYVRNEILRRDKSIKLDKAVLRRWVNGKFVTLVRRGTLSRHGMNAVRFTICSPVRAIRIFD